MLSLLSNLFSKKGKPDVEKLQSSVQEETTLKQEELKELGLAEATNNTEEDVDSVLSLHPTWEEELDQEKRYVLSFLHSALPAIKPSQVAINGFNLTLHPQGLAVSGFLRNGLSRVIKLEAIPVILLSTEGTVVARQTFDLSELGEIPACSDRPWEFVFLKENILDPNGSLEKWKLAFEIQRKPTNLSLDLDPNWETQLTEEAKQRLEEQMNKLPPVKSGEFNLAGITINKTEQEGWGVLVFLRNGTDKNITLQQIPLVLLDAEQHIVAKGNFTTENLEVKAGTCKPWQFIFPKEIIELEDPDFSKWSIRTPEEVAE